MTNSADRVRDTTTTTGTGSITLAGSAPTGYRTFASVYATGTEHIPYAIVAVDGSGNPTGQWEVGYGTLSASTTLTRDLLVSSSTGSAVNFSAGTKDVFVTVDSRFVNDLICRGRAEAMRLGMFTP
jgi:hypothetical protein